MKGWELREQGLRPGMATHEKCFLTSFNLQDLNVLFYNMGVCERRGLDGLQDPFYP